MLYKRIQETIADCNRKKDVKYKEKNCEEKNCEERKNDFRHLFQMPYLRYLIGVIVFFL
jgi:hypothetical protein